MEPVNWTQLKNCLLHNRRREQYLEEIQLYSLIKNVHSQPARSYQSHRLKPQLFYKKIKQKSFLFNFIK